MAPINYRKEAIKGIRLVMQFGWRCPLLAAAAAAAGVVEVEEGRIGRALSALCCANTHLDSSQVGGGSKQQEEE